MGTLRFHEATPVAEQARALTDVQFAKERPGLALVVEPYVAGSGVERTRALHAKARLTWPIGADGQTPLLLRLGRDPSCEVCLPHPKISKHHAILHSPTITMSSQWVVEDAGSTNGTLLNDQVLETSRPLAIGDGDSIVLGGMVVVRPYPEPSRLWEVLKRFETGAPRRKITERLDFELIVSTLRSLGAEAAIEGDTLHAKGLDGAQVRVRPEGSAVAVEWGSNDVYLKRKTVAFNDVRIEETVRGFVMEAIRLEDVTPPATQAITQAIDPLDADAVTDPGFDTKV